MTLFISNPSRGGAAPSVPGDPVDVAVTSPIQVSLRETVTSVELTKIQVEVGYAPSHAQGINGPFEQQMPRTKRGSIFQPAIFPDHVSVGVVGNALLITKGASSPDASTYFTSIDRGQASSMSAMLTAVIYVANSPVFSGSDPMGPLIGLEHGPKNTAVYCIFLTDGTTPQIRICGPSVNGTRVPDTYVPYDWTASSTDRQYILFWNDALKLVELWSDATVDDDGGVSTAMQIAALDATQFQQFSGTIGLTGGANDITGVYGTEGPATSSMGIVSVAVGADVGMPFVSGARAGGWTSYLDSDMTIGFSGNTDPTKLLRGGIWFVDPNNEDAAGQVLPSVSGYCRLLRATAGSNFSIYRDEPGFQKTATDGFAIEFECATTTSGGTGFATGAAIQISDGTTLFQLDFFFDGSVHNLGLLLTGGDPTLPSDHLTPTTAVDYTQTRLRLVVDSRRGFIDLFDVSDISTPLATWTLNRAQLPTATDSRIAVGFPVMSTPTIGSMDIYSLKYTYIYQAWETRDDISPTAANPAFTASSSSSGSSGPLNLAVMPGVLPPPFFPGDSGGGGGDGAGTGTVESDGFHIVSPGGTVLYYRRAAPFDSNLGGVIETSFCITSWRPATRSGVFVFIDDGDNAFMLSFVETDVGRFVCVPLSAGVGSFQEYAGDSGLGAQLSVAIDWTAFHTYRLERRPRDGLYLYIDNNPTPALFLADSARYSYPATQFGTPVVGFGQLTDEGATSIWQFVRDFFGSGYEISTQVAGSTTDVLKRLSNTRTTIVVTAGV